MDGPEDLGYFEQLADLLESEEDIPFESFYAALSGAEADTLSEITESYFEEMSGAIPDNADDINSLLENIKHQLLMRIADPSDRDGRRRFAEELFKFREWLNSPAGARVSGIQMSVLEAVTAGREGRLIGREDSFDFSSSLDYELDELVMDLGRFEKIDLIGEEQ